MKNLFLMAALLSAAVALADASVSDVVVKQNWPWGPEVNVDYTLAADAACDVDATISFTVGVKAESRSLTFYGSTSGAGHFTWDPVAEGFSGESIRNFKVTLTATPVSDRTYLVINLLDGSHEFLPDVPEGGWTVVHKTDKMVFRRIPAGTYVNGLNYYNEAKPLVVPNAARVTPRNVTLTSDFYIGIFQVTGRQYERLSGRTMSHSDYYALYPLYDDLQPSYYDWRGSPIGNPVVNWPATKYVVDPNSIVGKFRKLVNDEFLVDLPTEEMWEIAARAGTTTIYPNGGVVKTEGAFTSQTLTNEDELKQFAMAIGRCVYTGYSSNGPVGELLANGWGLYDVVGNGQEWMLDVGDTNARSDATDPVGPFPEEGVTEPKRAQKSCWRGTDKIGGTVPSYRAIDNPMTLNVSTRLCIHLKSLFGE